MSLPTATARSRIRRLALFVACICTGVLVGVIGSHLTGSDNWYLAIPALLAVVWLFVADPNECQRCIQPDGTKDPANPDA